MTFRFQKELLNTGPLSALLALSMSSLVGRLSVSPSFALQTNRVLHQLSYGPLAFVGNMMLFKRYASETHIKENMYHSLYEKDGDVGFACSFHCRSCCLVCLD